MTTRFAQRISAIQPSATMAVTARARELKAAGHDVVGFGAGEPDFTTPHFIIEAMVKAAYDGATGYGPVAGIPALRDAVAAHFETLYGLPFERDQVMVSVGGKQALYNLFQVLLDPGDEVLVPAPYWVSYPSQIQLAQGQPVEVETRLDQGFSLDLDRVQRAITSKTVGIVINSPSNPSGAVYDAATLRALADIVDKHGLWIISDDIYSHLRYDEGPFASILRERPDLRERIIIVHGASKTYAMTGWRLGFVGAPAPLIAKLSVLQSQSTSGATTFAQHGALAAITSDHRFLEPWLSAYAARRQRIVELLNAIDGIECSLPGGAFYCFPNIDKLLQRRCEGETIGSDMRFCQLLLEHAKVAIVPGTPFGTPGFARLSYACSMDDIVKGLERFASFAASLR